jgi:hypothetical protein
VRRARGKESALEKSCSLWKGKVEMSPGRCGGQSSGKERKEDVGVHMCEQKRIAASTMRFGLRQGSLTEEWHPQSSPSRLRSYRLAFPWRSFEWIVILPRVPPVN